MCLAGQALPSLRLAAPLPPSPSPTKACPLLRRYYIDAFQAEALAAGGADGADSTGTGRGGLIGSSQGSAATGNGQAIEWVKGALTAGG